jgi:hypothetical protein
MYRFIGKFAPTLIGLLFVYSGIYKLFYPGEAAYALETLKISYGLSSAAIFIVTVLEIYLGVLLLLKADLRYTLWMATGLMFAFTVFLWYLTTVVNPPTCGCFGLSGFFKNAKHAAVFGVFRNCLILWMLKAAYDYYCKAPSGTAASLGSMGRLQTETGVG